MREFIAPGQWIEAVTDCICHGYRYYDGVHRGFASATEIARLGTPEDPEAMRRARAAALRALRQRRVYAR